MLRLFVPPRIRRGAVGFETGRDHGVRFDGLLVEIRTGAAAGIKSVAADGPEIAAFRGLYLHQPTQRLQSALEHRLLARGFSAQNQGVGELGVVIGEHFLKPGPVLLRDLVKQSHQPRGQLFPDLRGLPVAAQPLQILVNAKQAERPGARRGELRHDWQGRFENLAGQNLKAPIR